jgi:diguanylate cyclase (GGDEF)-like protein
MNSGEVAGEVISNAIAMPCVSRQLDVEHDHAARIANRREHTLARCAWLTAKATAAPIALISVVDDQLERFIGGYGTPATWDASRSVPLAFSLGSEVVSSNAAFVIGSVSEHPAARHDLLRELGGSAYAGVPLRTFSGEVLGVLSVVDTEPRLWTPDDVRALDELAALLVDLLPDRAHEHTSGLRAGDASALFGADGVTPLAADEHPFTRALSGETVTQAECFVRLPGHTEGRWHRINATPLRDPQGVVRGAIVVGSDVTEQRLAQERLAQTVEALRALALIDELTGLHNRRGFTALAEHQIKVSHHTGRSLLVFFADLDDLKAINDTFGHEAGDQALRDAARLLRATFRESDLLARIGGDEFVVLACDATRDDADLFASRLHAALRAYNSLAERRFKLSISTGATAYDPRMADSLETLLKRADAAMYRDKRLRRTSERAATR